MPAVNVYLSEEEYVQLAYLAEEKNVKVTQLARRAVQEFLKKKEKEVEKED